MRIRQYKKFQITYNKKDKMFHAKLGKEREFTAKDENYLIELIDRDKKEQEADKKKKQGGIDFLLRITDKENKDTILLVEAKNWK